MNTAGRVEEEIEIDTQPPKKCGEEFEQFEFKTDSHTRISDKAQNGDTGDNGTSTADRVEEDIEIDLNPQNKGSQSKDVVSAAVEEGKQTALQIHDISNPLPLTNAISTEGDIQLEKESKNQNQIEEVNLEAQKKQSGDNSYTRDSTDAAESEVICGEHNSKSILEIETKANSDSSSPNNHIEEDFEKRELKQALLTTEKDKQAPETSDKALIDDINNKLPITDVTEVKAKDLNFNNPNTVEGSQISNKDSVKAKVDSEDKDASSESSKEVLDSDSLGAQDISEQIEFVESEQKSNTESEDTLEAEDTQNTVSNDCNIESPPAQDIPTYTSEDFHSPSDSDTEKGADEDEKMGQCISETGMRDSEESDTGPSQEKYSKRAPHLKQTTISDFYTGASKQTKKKQRTKKRKQEVKPQLLKRPSDRDTEKYRLGYPGKKDDAKLNANKRFYFNEIKSAPDGDYIDKIHASWFGNYTLLERHHGYIQWLFPIREEGMNWQAQPLQLHEAEAIKADPKAHHRVLESYKLMIDFYGMKIKDEETGELERSHKWESCFEDLNWSSHNYMRITRILKCLGELGYEHLKKGFIQFVLDEALVQRTLQRVLRSCQDYWIGTIKDDAVRDELHQFIEDHNSKYG